MENIVQSNNRDLRLVAVKVGVLSTLRLSLPDVPANATRVEVIVTNGDTHTAYGAHLDTNTERWLVDVAAAQFPYCGKQKYEIAYLLDGKQFWDGAGWVTVEDATTGGLTPSPAPDPARYVVTRINGYGAPNPDGEVRIPRTFVGTEDPATTDGFIEFDQYLNKETGALFVLCSVEGTLTWVKTAGAVFSVNGMVGAVEVQTLKINDEWRFSVAPGLSGEMAIRLEHLDFPAQGIWGIQTEMTIPTGLGTLAKSADIPDVVAPSESATEGQAADAKATHDALTGKLNTNWSSYTSFGWGESDAAIGYRAKTYDNAILMIDASWGPYFIVRINGTNYTLTFPNQGGRVVLSDEDTNELPEPIKAALFAGAAFREAVVDEIKSRPYIEQGEGGGIYVVIPETK